jgi:hypothetical protein
VRRSLSFDAAHGVVALAATAAILLDQPEAWAIFVLYLALQARIVIARVRAG